MAGAARQTNGRFAPGNPGGPGRPSRAVERDYLRALNDAVSVDDWKAVVRAALAQAKEGDPVARAWLEKYLIGTAPARLCDLAAEDVRAGLAVAPSDELLATLARDIQRVRGLSQTEMTAFNEANRLIGRIRQKDEGGRMKDE
jgi:hypothetical protein